MNNVINKEAVTSKAKQAVEEYNTLTKEFQKYVDECASYATSEQHRIVFGLKMLHSSVEDYNNSLTFVAKTEDETAIYDRLLYVETRDGHKEYKKYKSCTKAQIESYLFGLEKAEKANISILDNIQLFLRVGKSLVKDK